jgi:uncharacterized membrane protein
MPLWEIHPSLVHFPIALLLSAVALDLYAGWRRRVALAQVATGLILAGVLLGLLAALAGFLAYFTAPDVHTEEAHQRVYWHLGLALASVVLFAVAGLVRWRSWAEVPSVGMRLLGVVGGGVLIAAGYLGGGIVYHGGWGVSPGILSPELREGHHHGGPQGDHGDHGHSGESTPSHGEHGDHGHEHH